MKTRNGSYLWLAAAALGLTLGIGTAQAQDAPPPPAPGGPAGRIMVRTFGPDGDGGGFMGFEGGIAGKTVTNAPFTATVSTETTRTLADGNKIDETVTGTFARDSQGRTRREMTLPGALLATATGGSTPHAVFINDPVAGTSYILHPNDKTADQVPFRALGKIRRAVRGEMGAGKRFQNQTTTTDLGTQTINGVLAQGTRITRTIPAGQIGNEKPILIVTERWYSPDLQTYVLTKTTNPLMGNTTLQLTNIQRAEPDAALFQVPSDYTVNQRRGAGARRWKNRGTQPPSSQN
ncbi:MAG TPA: hypothetical protein VMF66_03160 [Candidatus Acidoferrum sp.]|nr:hypothetical protein [Candidatus Acidoferrum sp.]